MDDQDAVNIDLLPPRISKTQDDIPEFPRVDATHAQTHDPFARQIRRSSGIYELPGVRAEALDEAALPLGVEGVEGQRRLAGARDAGDRHELARAKLEIDALQVVGLGAAEDEHGNPLYDVITCGLPPG